MITKNYLISVFSVSRAIQTHEQQKQLCCLAELHCVGLLNEKASVVQQQQNLLFESLLSISILEQQNCHHIAFQTIFNSACRQLTHLFRVQEHKAGALHSNEANWPVKILVVPLNTWQEAETTARAMAGENSIQLFSLQEIIKKISHDNTRITLLNMIHSKHSSL